MFFVNII